MTDQPLRVALADDEPLARERLRDLLADRADVDLVAEAATGADVLAAVRDARRRGEPLDLVLLDVQMPAPDGLAVAEALRDEPDDARPAVVFVTAYDRYAVQAFDLHAVDYVLKPVEDDRFHAALDRAVGRRRGGDDGGLSARLLSLLRQAGDEPDAGAPALDDEAGRPLHRVAVQTGGRYHLVDVDEVDWIEGAGVYAKLVLGDKAHLVRTTLASLEERLDGDRFVRVHRSTIANLDRVREVHPTSHGEFVLLLADGTRLKVSRTYADNVRDYLDRLS